MSEVRNPRDGANSSFSTGEIDGLIADQHSFFSSGATRPLEVRFDLLRKILAFLTDQEKEILEALQDDLGKPDVEAWLSEVFFLRKEIKLILSKLKKWAKPKRASNPFFNWPASSSIRREPFGVTLVIGPWNYPLQLILAPTIGAIAAGNCVVLKPSEAAPATAALLEDFFGRHANPQHVTVVSGGPEIGAALLDAPFDYYFFTGGLKVGKLVSKAAGNRMVPCTLELGGKSPAIVDGSCNLKMAVERIVAGKFFNAGQTCMAPDFVAVSEGRLEEFTDELDRVIRSFYGSEEMELAHLPNQRQWDRLMNMIPEDAIKIGSDDPETLLLAPRWAVVERDSPAMEDEIFGPFLPVVTYSDQADLFDWLSEQPPALGLYVFSDSQDFAEETIDQIRSGSVCINDVMKQAVNLKLPFGGVGSSGYGRYRGEYSFECFSVMRPVTRRYFIPDPFAAHPPYGNLLERLKKFL